MFIQLPFTDFLTEHPTHVYYPAMSLKLQQQNHPLLDTFSFFNFLFFLGGGGGNVLLLKHNSIFKQA